MATEIFQDQVSTKECAGHGDRTRGRLAGRLLAKRTYFDQATAPGCSSGVNSIRIRLFKVVTEQKAYLLTEWRSSIPPAPIKLCLGTEVIY